MAGELVDQPLDGLQVAAAAQVASGVFSEPHGDLVQGLAREHLAEQLHTGLAGGLVVVQLGAYDRQVQQCGMQLGQLDGYLQRGVSGVRVVHHGVHAEVFHCVGDVARTAPTAGDQVSHDLHGHRMRVVTEQFLQDGHLVGNRAGRVGQCALQLNAVIEHLGDREQFVADPPRVLTGVAQFRGQRITRLAVCNT